MANVMKMSAIVDCNESGDDSKNMQIPNAAGTTGADLEQEWESFEKLITGDQPHSSNAAGTAAATEPMSDDSSSDDESDAKDKHSYKKKDDKSSDTSSSSSSSESESEDDERDSQAQKRESSDSSSEDEKQRHEDDLRQKLVSMSEKSGPSKAESRRRESRSLSSDREDRRREHRRSRDGHLHRHRHHPDRYRHHSDRHRSHGRPHRPHDRRRSRSPHRGSRHHRYDRENDRDRHYRHDRGHHRSSHNDRDRRRSPGKKPMNFKEQLKAELRKQAQAGKLEFNMAESLTAANSTNPSNLPLNSSNPLATLVMSAKDKVTPQQALIQSMAAMHQKVQQLTGVSVPTYYNPAAVNPLKYAEQVKKRKLLWSKAGKEENKEKEECKSAQWSSSAFVADDDGKIGAKFRKLMGIKEGEPIPENIDLSKLSEEQRQKQEELFMQLDREYEFARMTTHTHRGVGLGFQSQRMPDT